MTSRASVRPGSASGTPAVRARAPTLRSGWFETMLAQTGFLASFPHYAGVLSRVDPVASDVVPVAAMALRRIDQPASRLALLWNTRYFGEHPEHRVGVLLHEIQHVVYGHVDDPTYHRIAYPRLMEVAMELSANEGIEHLLPPRGFDIAAFVQFGIAPGQSTRERYVLLREAYESGCLQPSDIWTPAMTDTHRPRASGIRMSGLGDVIDARSDWSEQGNWSGRSMWLGAPSPPATILRMKELIAEHLQGERGGRELGTERSAGRVAKELERALFALEGGDARLKWPRILQEAFRRTRRVEPDYLRPNRRFPTRVGEIPGRRRRPPRPALIAAVDTSGSMDVGSLSRIVRELCALASLARLTVLECDAAVHRAYQLASTPKMFVGGGDTDFVPAFERAIRPRDVDGLIYFTDGRGSMPENPPNVPVLWAITHDEPFLAPFGSIVRLPD